MKKDGIRVEGHRGTWYVIDEREWNGDKYFLLEHEQFGDEAACIIVNEFEKVIMDDVYNGFDDLDFDLIKEEEPFDSMWVKTRA